MSLLDKKFILEFKDSDNLIENFSSTGNDIFVISALDGARKKLFLEIGYSSDTNSNTLLLEKYFEWSGITFEKTNDSLKNFTNIRKSAAIIADYTKYDFKNNLKKPTNNFVDYLSINIGNLKDTLEVLKKFPFHLVSFPIATIKHDTDKDNKLKIKSRQILQNHGYKIICSDVSVNGAAICDWYYNPKFIDQNVIKVYQSDKKDWQDILFKNEKREIKNNEKIDLGDVII